MPTPSNKNGVDTSTEKWKSKLDEVEKLTQILTYSKFQIKTIFDIINNHETLETLLMSTRQSVLKVAEMGLRRDALF